MPHRAGYFVLAYSWDHHCARLYDLLDETLKEIEQEAHDIGRKRPRSPRSVQALEARRHKACEQCQAFLASVRKREFVINSLGYRGYGVNRDLLHALEALEERGSRLRGRLATHFSENTGGLCRGETGLETRGSQDLDLGAYWSIMAHDTPMEANTAIFERMFFSGGYASMTIMKGSAGLHNGHPYHELKRRANSDFVHAVRAVFSGLSGYTEIGIAMLKKLHCDLNVSLDPNAGSFRGIDFPDRNGVTFEFGNFRREVSDLSIVLDETARSFHDLEGFIYNLARSYYMFIGIHPFWDGNGRVGRCFLNSLFLKKGLPPVTLNSDQEVFALPRYGGSMEQMHGYLKERLGRATNTYFHERSKLEAFGLMGRRIYNTSFDSGFHFRQIDHHQRGRIEVYVEALVIGGDDDLANTFEAESRIVLPDARFLSSLVVYCGLCDAPFSPWRHTFRASGDSFRVSEIDSETEGVQVFDLDFLLDLPRRARPGDFFACSVVSEELGLIFNNKGLNYSFKLE
jgi:hypothetical protein